MNMCLGAQPRPVICFPIIVTPGGSKGGIFSTNKLGLSNGDDRIVITLVFSWYVVQFHICKSYYWNRHRRTDFLLRMSNTLSMCSCKSVGA